uniref:Uncharacterized protein n=1 Tax=Arundo donax TaxID=35708 RepID=A0A0A9GIS5_ARUDO
MTLVYNMYRGLHCPRLLPAISSFIGSRCTDFIHYVSQLIVLTMVHLVTSLAAYIAP